VIEGSAVNLVTGEAEEARKEAEDSVIEGEANHITNHRKKRVDTFPGQDIIDASSVKHSQECDSH